jgi:alpha-L-fucosidase 2
VYPEGQKPTDGVPLSKPFKYWIQDDAPPASPHYQADYQPFGDLWLRFNDAGQATNYRRELDLTTALSRVTYRLMACVLPANTLPARPIRLMAVHLTARSAG